MGVKYLTLYVALLVIVMKTVSKQKPKVNNNRRDRRLTLCLCGVRNNPYHLLIIILCGNIIIIKLSTYD